MRDKLITYVDYLFAGAHETQENRDLKNEVLQNTLERYDDLVSSGKAPGAAYNLAISGIGDVSEMLDKGEFITQNTGVADMDLPHADDRNENKKTASKLMLAISIILYICCVIPVIIIQNEAGVCLMFLMIALATALIIFRPDSSRDKSKPTYSDNSLSSEQRLRKSIKGAVYSLFTAIYFIVSFIFGAWHITWVIFLIAASVSKLIIAIIDLYREMKSER